MSDSHDDRKAIIKAVDLFNHAGCSLVIHAGDYVAPFTIREFGKLEARFIGVFGNNDGEKKGLATQFSKIGSLYEPPHEFDYSGKRFVVMHDPVNLDTFVSRDDIDVIVYGHLHEVDIRPGRPLVINPGESCSWLTGISTVVLLDLLTMETEIVDLKV